jgi:NADPH:quinone reductase-like Zn-dependent oxidoreductase
MKAAITTAYGPPEVVRIEERPDPEPKRGEVLVRVSATSVSIADARIRGFDVPKGYGPMMRAAMGLGRPRNPVQGFECTGVVERTGPGVSGFAPGQRVMGTIGLKGGCHAELVCLRAERLFPVPDTLSDTEAAGFFFGGLTAAGFLIDQAKLAPGETILINGATGAVGSAAIQIARHIGARITAVGRMEKHALARDLGAETCIDYLTQPVEGRFDVIMDNAGTFPWAKARTHLAPDGRLLLVISTFAQLIGAKLRPRRNGRRLVSGEVSEDRAAMARLLQLHRDGAYTPVVGRVFDFADIVEAHRLVSSHHKQGNVIVTMMPAPGEDKS